MCVAHLASAIAFAQTAPTIQSDKADYAPGELVTLTGSNWQPGEAVNVVVNDDEGQTWSRNVDVSADASGNISDSFNLPDWFVATYKVTATGAQSGVATTSFTDGNVRASADLSGSDKWTLTAIKYTTTDCSGTGVPFNSQTLTGTAKSNNLAANDGESVRLTASATSTGGKVFTNWTTSDAFTDLGNREICVTGFKNGTREYVAHYVVNQAPVANNDSLTTNEDTAGNVNVLTNDTDANGDTLTVTANTNGANGSASCTTAGVCTYTPNGTFNGADSFTYTVSDGKGGTATGTVSVTVTAVNDAPSFTKGANETVNEDSGSHSVTGWATAISSGPANESSQALDFIVSNNNNALFTATGQPQVSANGTLSYTLAADANGSATVDVKLHDNGGTANGGVDTSAVQSFTITVTAVNDAPDAVNDSAETAEDTAKDINVLGNDTDVDGDSLSVSSVGSPNHGTATKNDDGTIKYTPNANYFGPDSFTYTVSDGNGGTDTATVNLTVNAVNDAPVGTDDTYTTDEDTDLTVSAANGLLKNDTDIENDQLHVDDADATTPGINPVSGPSHGQLTLNSDGSFTYKPNLDYNGSDSFDYRVCDNGSPTPKCSVETAKVNITINAVNDAPVAKDDSATTDEDTSTDINVIANDTDVDNTNDQLSVSSFTQPSNGTVSQNADGTLKYVPNLNFSGTDTFTYKAKDASNADSNAATVTITVNAVNDAPTVTLNGDALADEGQTKTYTFAVSDPDSGATFTVKSGFPDCGTGGVQVGQTSTTASGGSFDCRFPDGPANPTVRIQVTDGQADSNIATKSVAVANVNPTIGPLTVTGTGTACLGSNNVVTLSFSITDPGVDTHSGTINWGDTTTTTFTGSSVTQQHSYSAGAYTITVNASDSDGGAAAPKSTTSGQVSLLYNVSMLLEPVNVPSATTPMSVFKSGSTVPLRVIITDCNNQPVNGLVPRISFNRINPSTPALGLNEGFSTQPNDTNFLMRDAGNGQYIYNLNTKTLPDRDATYNATITDSKATQTAPATYGPKVTQTFGIRSK